MTKGEFIDEVAQRTGLSKKDAGAAVDAVLATITDTLKKGGTSPSPASASSTSPSAPRALV